MILPTTPHSAGRASPCGRPHNMEGVRSRHLATLTSAVALALAGCGSDNSPATASACLDGGEAFAAALAAAPGEVELDGTPLADCLTDGQQAGALAEVGAGMIDAARTLNPEARKEPLGDAPVQLGYLVGAVDARAEETGGIHRDLAINLEAEATFIPGDKVLPGGFQQRYEEGLAAGRDSVASG
jgi:hypothetical protein